MITHYEPVSCIKNVLKNYVNKENIFFVFSTDILASTWAEWCITHSEESGVEAVSLEQFIAWDSFKENYASSKNENANAIPSFLRKIFIQSLIQENKKNIIFKKIINPEFIESSDSYADWISKNILQLKTWHDLFTQSKQIPDDEDNDYLLLYKKYKEFLSDTLFEQAWCEPNFIEKEKTFIFFYLEVADDFQEYKNALKNYDNIISYCLPKENSQEINVYKYTNTKTELKNSCLYIHDLIFNKNVMPEKIALHIPDLETLKPYIKQELKNYCVPFTIRSGEPITVNSAARIFENINTCVQEDFSYDALRSLLLNAYLPWSEKNLNQNLVLEGKRLKCICNYNDDDIWVSSLKQTNTNEREINFYVKLKKSILQIYYATSFKNLLTAWSAFRNDFFSTDDFSSSANNILGRCITLLDKLVSIEDEYILPKKLKVDSPFSFFLNELKNTTYREQEVINGISVFEYKVAPIAPFDYNIVLDASQDNLEVARQNLPFVSLQKRKQLGVTEKTDLSEEFIKLYSTSASSRQVTIFSFSEETFSGFAIPHSFFKKDISPTDFSYLKEIDFFHQEKNLFLGEKNNLNKISANQAEQLDKWIFFNSMNETKEIENKNLKQKIEYILKEKRNCNKIIITQKDLKTFFPCKRKWIFQEALKISEDTFTVDLIDNFTSGNIHHKILELFFSDYVNAHLPIYDGSAFVPDNEKILQSIFQKAEEAILSLDKIKNQKFVIEVLLNQKEKFAENIVELLKVFLSEQKYGSHIVKFTEKWHTKFSEECEYGYGGIIDLVLENNELYDTIIDFKNTGSSLPSSKDCKKTEDETLADFQCPMYITLLDDKKNNISAMIFHAIKFSKSSKKIKTPIVNNLKKDSKEKSQSSEEYKSTLKVFEEYCDLFYKNISENDFTPVNFSSTCTDEEKKQNVKPYESCFSCQFKTICRTQYTISPHYLPGKKKI